jgi:hypothetical protein
VWGAVNAETRVWLEHPIVQILVEVAINQMRTLMTKVDKGSR